MIINEFTCPADMDALNAEVAARKLGPGLIAAIILVEQGGIGSTILLYRVLYWDDTAD